MAVDDRSGAHDRSSDPETYLSLREARVLIAAAAAAEDARSEAHARDHAHEQEAIDKALANEARAEAQHRDSHDRAHESHEEKHSAEGRAVEKAEAAAKAALKAALDDHHREHEVHEKSHNREHEFTKEALTKAEKTTDERFKSTNEFREQLRDQASTFVTRDVINTLTKEIDRRFADVEKVGSSRYETNRTSITAIEKGDLKQEGRGLGQTGALGAIVASVGFASLVIGLIVVVANLLTGGVTR